MKFKFTGYYPDADPTSQGVINDCESMIPTPRGLKGAYTGITAGADPLAAACYGAAIAVLLSGSYRIFAASLTKIYELVALAWEDVSRVGDYTTSATSRVRFAQFGNTTVSCNGAQILQQTSSGDFADIASSPIAHCMDVTDGFIMLGNVDLGGGAGLEPDRWICSAYNDITDWTPDVATQCATGRLVATPGKITAVRRLGSNCVYYKGQSIYLANYVGAPAIWDFQLIPGNIGVSGQEAVVNIGSEHVFVGYEDIYRFDGSRPIAIGEGIRETFFADLNKQYRANIIGSHDFQNGLIYFHYPSISSASGALDSCIVYNYKTGTWGRDDRNIEYALEYLTGQITYANIGDFFASYAAINVNYDSPFWNNTSPVNGYFGTDHTLYSLTGMSSASSLTTGNGGDDSAYIFLSRARPQFTIAPTSATMTNYYKETSGSAWTTGDTTTMDSGKFDLLISSPWHKLKYNFVGDIEITGHDLTAIQDGEK